MNGFHTVHITVLDTVCSGKGMARASLGSRGGGSPGAPALPEAVGALLEKGSQCRALRAQLYTHSRSSQSRCLEKCGLPPTRTFHQRDLHKCPKLKRKARFSAQMLPKGKEKPAGSGRWAPPAEHPAGARAPLRAPSQALLRRAGGRRPLPALLGARRMTPGRLPAGCRCRSARHGSGAPRRAAAGRQLLATPPAAPAGQRGPGEQSRPALATLAPNAHPPPATRRGSGGRSLAQTGRAPPPAPGPTHRRAGGSCRGRSGGRRPWRLRCGPLSAAQVPAPPRHGTGRCSRRRRSGAAPKLFRIAAAGWGGAGREAAPCGHCGRPRLQDFTLRRGGRPQVGTSTVLRSAHPNFSTACPVRRGCVPLFRKRVASTRTLPQVLKAGHRCCVMKYLSDALLLGYP